MSRCIGNSAKPSTVKKPQLYSRAVTLMVAKPRWRSARMGAVSESFVAAAGVFLTSTIVATSAIAIKIVTPKNRPRQLMRPRTDPISGPVAMPIPSAVS